MLFTNRSRFTVRRNVLFLACSAAAAVPLFSGGCGGDSTEGDNIGGDSGNLGGRSGSSGNLGGEGGGSGTPASADLFCDSDKDCTASGAICDTARFACVECLTDDDCIGIATCENSACEAHLPCASSKDCSTDQVCDTTLAYCVECVTSADCADGLTCSNSECRTPCVSDKDCTAQDEVCGTLSGVCVGCNSDADCGATGYCGTDSECLARVCEEGDAFCQGDDLVSCNEQGSGFASSTCAYGCTDGACDDEPSGSGGGGSGTCAGNTGDICGTIAAFTGTQAVDGVGDEFCDVPGHVITFANSAYQAVTNVSADTTATTATVRAAWDTAGLHAHVHVNDPAVLHEGIDNYDGDNVQFFVSADAPTSYAVGASYNGGSGQVTIRPAASNKTEGATIVGPTTGVSYKTRIVSGGYEVEFFWPWPAANVPTSAAQIGFDVLIGVQNVEATNGRDFEFGYALEPVAGTEYCAYYYSDPVSPWCDARHWCTPTLE